MSPGGTQPRAVDQLLREALLRDVKAERRDAKAGRILDAVVADPASHDVKTLSAVLRVHLAAAGADRDAAAADRHDLVEAFHGVAAVPDSID